MITEPKGEKNQYLKNQCSQNMRSNRYAFY